MGSEEEDYETIFPGKDQGLIKVENGDAKLIFFENWVEVEDTFFIFWISNCGPKKEASRFKYSLKIKSREDKENILYEGKSYCVPCDISHEEMKNRKAGILISKEIIKAAGCCWRIFYTLTIGQWNQQPI